MTIVFLSSRYYQDRRLLDNAGKLMKPLGSPLLIIPAPDLFWNQHTPVGVRSDLTFMQFHEIYNRALIDRLGAAMLPAISMIASDRGIVTEGTGDQLLLNDEKIQTLTGNQVALVLSPFIRLEENANPCTLSSFIRALTRANTRFVFLNQSGPPPGISTFREVDIWSEGHDLIQQDFTWLKQWPTEVPIALADDFSMRSVGSELGQLLTLKA